MKYKLKEGVSLAGLQLVMRQVIMEAGKVWEEQGISELYITSGTEGNHGTSSLHPFGLALDLRLPLNPGTAAEKLRRRLGSSYDVVLERTHIHTEYDPK